MAKTVRMQTAVLTMNNGKTYTYTSTDLLGDINSALVFSSLGTIKLESGEYIVAQNICSISEITYSDKVVED